MNKEPNIIAIIPARGGSKRLPRKNIRLLNGEPLIYYTIAAAKKSKYLQRLLVSTADSQITEIARGYGAEVIDRPESLAQDDTPSRPVYQHVISHLEEIENYHPDIIVALQPTSPCRLAEDIDEAIEIFLETDCDSVVSVCEAEHPPHWMFTLEEDRLKPVLPGWEKIYQRQLAPKTYRLNGAVYVIHRDVIMEHKKGVMGSDIRPFIMPLKRSIDIDTDLDLKLAELLISERETCYDR
ncbi:cytidylyltransferase domain-containing protein [Chloroflexota bacterium]